MKKSMSRTLRVACAAVIGANLCLPVHAGLTANGLTANGLTANGLTANGLTANGRTMNGTPSTAAGQLPTVESLVLPDGTTLKPR
jgi:GLTT repeat (6 copies)